MEALVQTEYVSAGGNRHSAASDWSSRSGVLAYGADQNIALWSPLDQEGRGVSLLLKGHGTKATAVRFAVLDGIDSNEVLITGSADGEVRLWKTQADHSWTCEATTKAHDGAVNCIADLAGSGTFASGGADATIKLWHWRDVRLAQVGNVSTKPRFIPLSLAFGSFTTKSPSTSSFLVAAGTRNDIQVYGVDNLSSQPQICHSATLTGHEGWVRSLALRRLEQGDYLLASTSADKYARLWRFSGGDAKVNGTSADKSGVAAYHGGLTAKVQKVSVADDSFSITFEALLLGHEDWIYSAAWCPTPAEQLLTASADGSLTIWEPDPSSGVWVSITRLGEISGQKGATTATGSAGGFWNALWSPDANAVSCLGRTGSWRLWQFDKAQQYWTQKSAATGHVSSVTGISWAPDGSYLLSTGSDQTTRLHAEWRRGTKRTWHEFARPQIHGYDLNCVSTITGRQFASGADEKLLRVFDKPRSTAELLQRLCKIEDLDHKELPETAAIPVLGLSNKAVDQTNGTEDAHGGNGTENGTIPALDATFDQLNEPPSEDLLARHTLWPEHEKLYGHGYEISESASNGQILATACKASSLDHAVIRLYDTATWNEIRPPLAAHTLTVTRLAWSPQPPNILLSVGRDRQWALFKHSTEQQAWQLVQSNPKAHSRMILDAAWSPAGSSLFFATAGRDKCVKLWAQPQPEGEFSLAQTITLKAAVTAIVLTHTSSPGLVCVAAGEDTGMISLHIVDVRRGLVIVQSTSLPELICPSRTVNRLCWRPEPSRYVDDGPGLLLAVASADSSVRILRIDVDSLLPRE